VYVLVISCLYIVYFEMSFCVCCSEADASTGETQSESVTAGSVLLGHTVAVCGYLHTDF
jgi:hypothetical protein